VGLEALERAAAAGEIEQRLLAPAAVLGFPSVRLDGAQLRRVSHGGDVPAPPASGPPAPPGTRFCALDAEGTLVALLEARPDRRLWGPKSPPGCSQG
jgi:hypothetical protein